MTREELRDAAESLRQAADAATDAASGRLREQANKFDDHADADRGPDHGRLAHHEHVLTEIADDEGGEVADHVEAALDSIRAYRETVEGV
jgi:hypothetical protein